MSSVSELIEDLMYFVGTDIEATTEGEKILIKAAQALREQQTLITRLQDMVDGATSRGQAAEARIEELEKQVADWNCSECGWHHAVDCEHKQKPIDDAEVTELLEWLSEFHGDDAHHAKALIERLAREAILKRAADATLQTQSGILKEKNAEIERLKKNV